MKRALTVLVLLIMVASVLTSCAPTEEKTDELNVVLLIAATESDYWGKYCRTGAENAIIDIEEKYGVKVNFEVQGPAAESECEQFVAILETLIGKKPDGIAMGGTCPEGSAAPVIQATELGIRVNMISLGIDSLTGDQYGTLYECDQPEQGKLAAEALYDAIQKKGLPLDGVVAIQMSVVVPVLEEKKEQFIETLQKLAPDITILDAEYNENDVNIGIGIAQAQLAKYGDRLVGFFGECNISGDAIGKAIEESNRTGTIAAVAVDSDPAEIEALRAGHLDALIVQTPYEQAYRAVMNIAEYIFDNKEDADRVNIPGVVVTTENMDEPEFAALLDPTILAKKK